MNYIEAITNGLEELMENDENVFMMGEDIGVFEGAFKATKGLFDKYGPFRVIDTQFQRADLLEQQLEQLLLVKSQ